MLSGFRGQLLLLLLVGLLFSAVLLWRLVANNDESQQPVSPDFVPASTLLPDVPVPAAKPIHALETASINEAHTFREGLVGLLQHLNPLLSEPGSPAADVSGLIFEGLTRNNLHGEPVPALAREWLIAAKGLEYVVTLRDDVLWQDGVPFSAADVIYTMSLLQAPDFPGDAAVGQFWRTVEVEVLAANVLRFRLTQPLGSFLDRLSVPILPWHALQGTSSSQMAEHPFNLAPIGTGQWQLEALGSREGRGLTQVDLRPAPTWHDRFDAAASPAIGRIRFQVFMDFDEALAALQAGAIDGLATRNWQEREPLLVAARSAPLHLANTVGQTLGLLIFNWQREETWFFREQRVRLALASSLERASVVERLLWNRAVPADSPLWPGSWGWTSSLAWPAADLDAARWLLETARTREVAADAETTSAPTSFTILSPEDAALVGMMREFAAQWAQLGVEVRVSPEPAARYQQRLQVGDFDAALVELTAGYSTDPDIYAFWHEGQYSTGLNYGGVDDRRISELLERARREPYEINRASLYAEFQQVFVERAIAIPLYYPLESYATSTRVSGVQLGLAGVASNRFANLNEWSLALG